MIVGPPILALAALGASVHQDTKEPKTIQLTVAAGGISIE